MEIITHSKEETVKFAEEYGKTLKKGDVVLLKGEMGAGKTVFTKGVALSLGIKSEVTSPTYAYLNDYDGKLFHYDCYRLSSGEDAEALGLTEYFDSDGICLIEWSENIVDVLPENAKVVKIEDFGCFVQLWPGCEGLVHVSQLADTRVDKVEDIVKLGDEIIVKALGLDKKGRQNFSRKDALPKKDTKNKKTDK